MRRKPLLVLALITYLATNTFSQIIYTDIPDDTLKDGGVINIDFNGDLTPEFTFEDVDITISSIKPGLPFHSTEQIGVIDSINESDIIKSFSVGKIINSDNFWIGIVSGYIDPSWAYTPFSTDNDTYLAAKFDLATNTHFGWIRVHWNGNGMFIIKDLAYESTPNTSINTGDTITSNPSDIILEDFAIFSIYPNPAKNSISLKKNKNLTIKSIDILDISGKVVKNFKFDTNIDVSNLNKGVYFLRLTDISNRDYTKKLIIK